MAFLRKKKRPYHRRPKQHSFLDSIDLTLDWETGRDIFIALFIILALISLLSSFNFAGSFGQGFHHLTAGWFGILAYILPIVFGYATYKLIQSEEGLKLIPLIALFVCYIVLTALFGPFGGGVGKTTFNLVASYLGNVVGYLALLVLFIILVKLSIEKTFKEMFAKPIALFGGFKPIKLTGGRTPVYQAKQMEKTRPAIPQFSPNGDYQFPPLDLLNYSTTKANAGNVQKNAEVIKKTLQDFGVRVDMGEANIGPTVTQYCLKPEEGMKLTNIVARSNDLALALAAHPIRVEAPIPGKAAVGIEVPNKVAAMVTLREILESEEMIAKKEKLWLALGRDVAGEASVINLAKMPHMLVAGSTGSGKSVCINAIITTLIMRNSPQDLRMLLVDPKRVEFTRYNGIPHLMTPVITEVDKTVSALKWAVSEMEQRFKTLAEVHARNIDEYNQKPADGQKMPYLVIIIDELADLMVQASNEVEGAIVRLAQMARAVGIHLIIATQRPSVDVITGLIKANISARIAFAVASQVDSRTIIDMGGAEKLLGNGDMLFLGGDVVKPKRIQGVLVSEKEIKDVTDFLKQSGPVEYDEGILTYKAVGSSSGAGGFDAGDDDLYDEAKELVVQSGKASASLLQRRLRVGYARAARLLDLLEQEGVIGPPDGAKPREVLIGDYGDDFSKDVD